LVHDAKSPEYIGNVNACDAAGGGIGHNDYLGGQQHLFEFLRGADVRFRSILANADADGALRNIEDGARNDVAIGRHLIENGPRQYCDVRDFTALDAFSEVAGLAEADAHPLPSDFPEARLKLADDFSHTARAQDFGVRATVPFDFVVKGKVYPAGQYTILPALEGTRVLSIRSEDGNGTKMVMSDLCTSSEPVRQTKLVFDRAGDSYFLHAIWIEGRDYGRSFPKTKAEIEMASNQVKTETVIVAARITR
jgi:hypothetical protein